MSQIKTERIIGVMSGSSLDGIDLAVCDVSFSNQLDMELVWSYCFPLEHQLKVQILKFNSLNPVALADLSALFSRYVANCISKMPKGLSETIDYVSIHGHTIFHHPERGFTYQLCNGGLLAALTGYPVICDFRSTDIGLGGTGTPLAPLIDKTLFQKYDFALNLGGIANITYQKEGQVLAFDICPCNQLMNWLVSFKDLKYDNNGELASQGVINNDLIEKLSKIEYSRLDYPKSLDNQWITLRYRPLFQEYLENIEEALHTLVIWISKEIKLAIAHIFEKEKFRGAHFTCLVSGGGAHNSFLINEIKSQLDEIDVSVVIPEAAIIDYKEAILMCMLGFNRKHNKANVFKDVTGAEMDSIGGAIYQGTIKRIDG